MKLQSASCNGSYVLEAQCLALRNLHIIRAKKCAPELTTAIELLLTPAPGDFRHKGSIYAPQLQ